MNKWSWLGVDKNLSLKDLIAQLNQKLALLAGVVNGKQKQLFVDLRDFGINGKGAHDDASAVQKAIKQTVDADSSLFVPPGTFIIGSRVAEQTSGARLRIFGSGPSQSVFKAADGFTDEMFWFGNNTTNAVYGLRMSDIGLDGGAKTNGNTGIVTQQNGLSHFHNIRIRNCATAAICDGSIHMVWDGHNEITGNSFGIRFKRIPHGTPSGDFDISVTQNLLSLSTNMSGIWNTWFDTNENGSVHMEGGMVEVENCVFQNPGGDATKSVVVFDSCNEAYDYGGGPRFRKNWVEAGNYKYWVEVINSRNAVLTDNFFSGPGAAVEGAFLLWQKAENCVIERNSFRGVVSATPTESRLRNAAVYLHVNTATTFSFTYRDNYLTKTGGTNLQFVIDNVNMNGTTSWRYCNYSDMNGLSPVVYDGTGTLQTYYPDKNVHACGVISWSAGVPSITHSYNLNLIVDSGVGFVTLQYSRLKEQIMQPFTATAHESASGTGYIIGTMRSSTAVDRVRVYSTAGVATDPEAVSFVCYGGTQ